jgi:hypothetical protein
MVTTQKILHAGYFWPSIFKECIEACCTSFVTLVRKIEVLASSVGFAEQDSCKEKG